MTESKRKEKASNSATATSTAESNVSTEERMIVKTPSPVVESQQIVPSPETANAQKTEQTTEMSSTTTSEEAALEQQKEQSPPVVVNAS
jgi:hypothetical protein